MNISKKIEDMQNNLNDLYNSIDTIQDLSSLDKLILKAKLEKSLGCLKDLSTEILLLLVLNI